MSNRIIPVGVTVDVKDEVAKAVAMAELEGVFSSTGADAKLKALADSEITVESLARYFKELTYLQAAFCEQKREPSSIALRDLGFTFSEPKNLYLPILTATILANMGDVAIGPYHIEVCAAAEAKVDRTFIFQMSEALYRNQHILACGKDQIGVANREVPADMMASIVVTMSTSDQVLCTRTFTGVNPDSRAVALNAMMGIVLKDAALNVLYPFEDYVTYARPSRIVALQPARS